MRDQIELNANNPEADIGREFNFENRITGWILSETAAGFIAGSGYAMRHMTHKKVGKTDSTVTTHQVIRFKLSNLPLEIVYSYSDNHSRWNILGYVGSNIIFSLLPVCSSEVPTRKDNCRSY